MAADFEIASREAFFKQSKKQGDNGSQYERTYAIESFKNKTVIGEGTYGKVYKAETKPDVCLNISNHLKDRFNNLKSEDGPSLVKEERTSE